MSGVFGVVSIKDCVDDLFYGTDYHSHLGTRRGGLAVINSTGFTRIIHDITNHQFRSKFEDDILKMQGNKGIGVISDLEDQPLIIRSHLGDFAIVSVGKILNAEELVRNLCTTRRLQFTEMVKVEENRKTESSQPKEETLKAEDNQTELVAALINEGSTFEQGIQIAQEAIKGSCSLLLLTGDGIFAARDKLGRTPIVIGRKLEPAAYAATLETCALPNIGFNIESYLGPGEMVFMTKDRVEQKKAPGNQMQICAFLWIFFGFPASNYENINVECVRNRCGAALAKNDDVEVDIVTGIPDSGTGHGLGYAAEKGIPFKRPLSKYTPTWPRSFMPQHQEIRDLVAKMKLIPIVELIKGQRLLLCEDSIVRGTQLRNIIRLLYLLGVKEVYMRPACPPLLFICKFLNFSRSKLESDLAARKSIIELEGSPDKHLDEYIDEDSERHAAMNEKTRYRLSPELTSLKYQRKGDMIRAIGLPKEKICTYCWDGVMRL